MRERDVEHRFVSAVSRQGGWAIKLTSPTMTGLPDRLVLLPGGRIAFVELKSPGKHPRPLQELRMRQLRGLGFPVYVINDPRQVEQFLNEIDPQKGGDAP